MKKLKLDKKAVANLSKPQMSNAYGGESLVDTTCRIENTQGCTNGTCNSMMCNSQFLACKTIDATVCPASGDGRCYTMGCTVNPTRPITYNCTNVCP